MSTTDLTISISRRDGDGGGRYEAHVDGYQEPAVLDFHWIDDRTLDATHTFVPVAMRGLGIGKALIDRLAADARAAAFRIVPSCPFVRAHLTRDPDRADLIAAL